MTDDNCGWPTADGSACMLPASRHDGRCHHHTGADGRGRPTKFNDERRDAILNAARNGTTIEGCARAAGIHHSTLYDWLDKYGEFSEAFSRARARAEQALVEEVRQRDPKWILERSYDYVKTERREIEKDVQHRVAEGFEFVFADE